jgi:hypothetical protein
MDDQKEVILQSKHDALSQSSQGDHGPSGCGVEWWIHRPEQERGSDERGQELGAEDPIPQGLQIDFDVG